MKRLSRKTARGFTLLEVIVSLGILAVALLAIGNLNGGAIRMHAYSKTLTVAVQLARGKMLDVEQQLHKDGLSDFSKEYHGDFSDEGWPEYTWKADVIKPDLDIDPQRIADMISQGMGLPTGDQNGANGSGGSSGAAPTPLPGGMQNPLAAGGPLSGLIDQQIQSMTETIKNSVREIKLTISWKVGAEKESFDLVEHVVVLPTAPTAAPGAAAGTTGAPGTGIPQIGPLNQLGGQFGSIRNNVVPLGGLNTGFP